MQKYMHIVCNLKNATRNDAERSFQSFKFKLLKNFDGIMSSLVITTTDSSESYANQQDRLDSLESLKVDIKTWERGFAKENARAPTKEDLKSLPWIYAKYRMYQKLKDELREKKKKEELARRKKKEERQCEKTFQQEQVTCSSVNTEADGDANRETHNEDTTFVAPFPGNPASRLVTPRTNRTIDVLGPTPQINGRVLGLFEIRSPVTPNGKPDRMVTSDLRFGESTPSRKPKAHSQVGDVSVTDVAVTPTRKKAMNSLLTPTKINVTPLSARTLETPTSSQTPLCLSGTLFKDSESPLAPKKVTKRLSSMIAELQQMSDIEDYELDVNEINDYDDEHVIHNVLNDDLKQTFKKGQKRTTKRVISKLFGCFLFVWNYIFAS